MNKKIQKGGIIKGARISLSLLDEGHIVPLDTFIKLLRNKCLCSGISTEVIKDNKLISAQITKERRRKEIWEELKQKRCIYWMTNGKCSANRYRLPCDMVICPFVIDKLEEEGYD